MTSRILSCFLLSIAIAISLFSCKNKTKAVEPVIGITKDTSADKQVKNYMPIETILRGEIKWIEDYAGAVLLKTNYGKKKDSTYISLEKFKQLAASVMSPEMESGYFIAHFTEETVANEGIGGLSFLYASTDTGELRKVIVYTSRTETSDKVSRVYFERAMTRGDTSITQRCTWKMQHYLTVVETAQLADGTQFSTVRKAIYDPSDYATE